MIEKEIRKLIKKSDEIYSKLLNQGDCPEWSTEVELIEATGRLRYSKSEAIKTLENFIEDHEEYLT